MEHILDLLEQNAAVLLFILGFTLLLMGQSSALHLIRVTADSIYEEKNVYTLTNQEELVENKLSGAELIAMIHNSIECELEIEGFLITEAEYGYLYNTSFIEEEAMYKYSYEVSQSGTIIKLVATR